MSGITVLRNCLFFYFMFITAFLGSLFILFPLFPLLFLNRPVWRRVIDQIIGLWLCLPVGLMEYFLGIQFRVTGDRIRSTEKAVIVMNHRTRLDWLFLWPALFRMDVWLLTSEKIILKKQLRNILGAGWAMACNNFVFLERSLEQDMIILRESAQYLACTGNPYQVVIFPEGTDLCPNTLVKSHTYAQCHNLPMCRNVLHPRTNGLLHLVQELRRNDGVDFIYDFTVAYPDEIVQTEIDFAKTGQCPRSVEFHCRRYRIDEIAPIEPVGQDLEQSNAQLNRWCREAWLRKEAILTKYYDRKNDNNNRKEESLSLREACEQEERVGPVQGRPSGIFEISRLGNVVLAAALSYWAVSVTFWLYALWAFWWLKYYALAGILTFKFIEYRCVGLERFEIALWKRGQV